MAPPVTRRAGAARAGKDSVSWAMSAVSVYGPFPGNIHEARSPRWLRSKVRLACADDKYFKGNYKTEVPCVSHMQKDHLRRLKIL